MDVVTDTNNAFEVVGLIADYTMGILISGVEENIKRTLAMSNGVGVILLGRHVSLTDLLAIWIIDAVELVGEYDINISGCTRAHQESASCITKVESLDGIGVLEISTIVKYYYHTVSL